MAAPPAEEPTDARPGGSQDATTAGRPVFANCVVHTGESRKTSTRIKKAGGELQPQQTSGSCALNAECVQNRGRLTPGDGLVDLACKGKACTCTLQPLAPRSAPTLFSFHIDAPCTSGAMAKTLLIERCMQGER